MDNNQLDYILRKKYLPVRIHKDYDKFSGKSGTPATKIKTPTAPKKQFNGIVGKNATLIGYKITYKSIGSFWIKSVVYRYQIA